MPNGSETGEKAAQSGNVQERWYIMFHPKPEIINWHLSEEKRRREDCHEQDFIFVIPYLRLNRAELKDDDEQDETAPVRGWLRKRDEQRRKRSEAENNNSLRNCLHRFVFIKSTKQLIDQIRALPWNREGLYRLSYRYTHSGEPLCVTDMQMQPMLRIIALYQHRFSVTDFDANTLSVGQVLIQEGPFQGSTATVLKARRREDGYLLTLGIAVFRQEFLIELKDVDAKSVKVLGGSIDSFLQPYFIDQMEKDLTDILRIRVRHMEDAKRSKENQTMLDSYSNLLTLSFEEPSLQKRFCALQLLHATLLRDARLKVFWLERVLPMLPDDGEPADDEDAFLLAVLFVATRKGAYRKAAKAYVQTHSEVRPMLPALLKTIKDISTR